MIQRVQSLFLFGAAILALLILFFPIWTGIGSAADAGEQAQITALVDAFAISIDTQTEPAEGAAYIASLAILSAITALFTIFRFKNRILQMRLCSFNLLLLSALIGTYFLAISRARNYFTETESENFQTGFYLPIAAIVLTWLANKYIKKDEKLVRSVDRLR
ncbi:DUF4293 domain-containing protein [Cytophagaceae bacterium ABcell3]|nr:DUF4293 domain-containing protein [Cytophagaceae bacterium ABcell3]